MTPKEINEILCRQIESFCQFILPNGKRSGHEWEVGSVEGEAGQSLKVHLTGSKAGVWRDFAADQGGDLIDLWAAVNGVTLADAIRECKDWAGIVEHKPPEPRRAYTKPNPKMMDLPEHVVDWFIKRGISRPTLEKFGVAWNGREIVFPAMRDGEVVAVKYRSLPKRFRQEAGQEPSLFGWQAVPDSSRAIVICEGEIDALSFGEWGIPALSVPMGGGTGEKHSWIETEFDNVARFDQIYLCMDMDEQGQAAAQDIADRLGIDRCRIVDLPHKDANECLVNGVDRNTIMRRLRGGKTMDPPELRSAADYETEIINQGKVGETGLCLPWKKTYDYFRMRQGELIILAGINGHGKTEVAGNIVAGVLQQQAPVLLASLEFKPSRSLGRLVRQISGTENSTDQFKQHIIRGFEGALWVYDARETKGRLLEVMKYARRRYNIRFFVIDNLAKCGFSEDDYSGQKAYADELSEFARDTDSTVLLVAHMRKGRDEDHQPGKMDVKGSGGLTDMADSLLSVWRNKPKEEKIKKGTCKPGDEEEPDCVLTCSKQRNGEHEPTVLLWFDQGSHQFLGRKEHTARPFVQYSAAPVERSA